MMAATAGRTDDDPIAGHRAWAQIDLAAVRANVHRLREAAGDSEVMAIVKADAYGHGLIPVSQAIRSAGAPWLGVALLEEAVALRRAGDDGRILAWLCVPGGPFAECVQLGVDLNVGAEWMLDEIVQAAREVGQSARVHLKVDTGLGRAGSTVADWPGILAAAGAAAASGEIEIVGIWSHMALADNPGHPTVARQVEVFEQACEVAAAAGIRPPLRHLANSAATFALPRSHYDLVRPGISVYGISPGPLVGSASSLGLRPAMTFAGRVVSAKRVGPGQGVSYGHEYVTSKDATLALVPIGYADGVQRRATNSGPVFLAGRRNTVAGRVCMDQFVVDVGDDQCAAGDTVILFGPGDDGEPTAEEWAEVCETIAYEIVTCVGPRVPRTYVGGD